MRIIKTSTEVAALKLAEKKANIGCNKCPCCKESYKGIPAIRTWYESGLFKNGKHMKVQCYTCRSC